MNVLNDIGYGIAGLVQGLNSGLDRQFRERVLARQDALARSQLALQQQQLERQNRQFDIEQQAYASLPQMIASFGGGGGMSVPGLPGQAPPSTRAQGQAPQLPQNVADLASYWTKWYGLTPEQSSVIPRIIATESGGNPWAHNKANRNGTDDFGLMQINSSNLGRVAPGQNVFDASENIRIGTEIFRDALRQSGGDIRGALGAYNTGKTNPNAPYVDKVLGATPAGNNTLAAGGNTASDVPPGYGMQGQGGGYRPMTQQQIDLLTAMKAHPSKVIRDAGAALEARDKAMREAAGWESPEVKRQRDSSAAVTQALEIERGKQGIGSDKSRMEAETSLRKELSGEAKTFKDITSSYTALQQSAKRDSPQGDIALIYQLMKLFDPGSVVRESEFSLAEASRGLPTGVMAKAQKLWSGERLLPEERQEFVALARSLYGAHRKNAERVKGQYQRIAESNGLRPENVLIDFGLAEDESNAPAPQPDAVQDERPGRPPLSSFHTR